MIVHSQGKFVECGKIGRPWGVHGQFSVFWNSGACPVEIGHGKVYMRESDGGYVPHVVLSSRKKGSRFIVAFKGVTTPHDAAKLTHKILYLQEEALPQLKTGEFYCYQVLGLHVETEDGKALGQVVNIFSTGSNDIYEIKPLSEKQPTILIPAIKDVVIKVDLKKGKIVIRPMEGMLD